MNKIRLLFRLLFALTLIIGLFYIRLIPRTSRDLWENMTHQQLCITLFTVVLLLLNLYGILKKLGYIKVKTRPITERIVEIKEVIVTFLSQGLKDIYESWVHLLEYVSSNIFDNPFFYYNSLRRLLLVANKKKYLKYYAMVLLILDYAPKIILLGALIMDVLVYHRLDYTFRCIPWLLLSFIPTFVIYMLTHYYDQFHEEIYNLVQKRTLPQTDEALYSYKPEYQHNPPPLVKDFNDFFYNHVLVFLQLESSLILYTTLINHIKQSSLFLVLTLLRLIIYIYILFYGIF